MKTPILSICIPTYQRSDLLKNLLDCISRQVKPNDSDVEIIVSDNASKDSTYEVVKEYQKRLPLNYHRNHKNLGAAKNVLICPDYASGEFCWILGDDELIYQNSISTILEKLKNIGDTNGLVIGFTIEAEEERPLFLTGNDRESSKSRPIFKNVHIDEKFKFWEDTFKLSSYPALYTSVVSIVFRRLPWLEAKSKVKFRDKMEDHTSLETTFPHTCIWAHMFSGEPIFLHTKPVLHMFVGRQEWFSDKWPTMLFVQCLDLCDLLHELKANQDSIKYYRSRIFLQSNQLSKLLCSPSEYADRFFSFRLLMKKYGRDPLLWDSLMDVLVNTRGLCSQIKIFMLILSTASRQPITYFVALKSILKKMVLILKKVYRLLWKKGVTSSGYEKLINNMDRKAQAYFISNVNAGKTVSIRHPVYLKNPKYITVGDKFLAGPGFRIEAWDRYHSQSCSPTIRIGNNVSFNYWCHVGANNRIEIGDNVLIGSGVLITDHQHGDIDNIDFNKTWRAQPLFSKGPVIIEDNVWVGENACIMPGVTIGRNSIIGANSVVTKDVPPNAVVVGNPARAIRTFAKE